MIIFLKGYDKQKFWVDKRGRLYPTQISMKKIMVRWCEILFNFLFHDTFFQEQWNEIFGWLNVEKSEQTNTVLFLHRFRYTDVDQFRYTLQRRYFMERYCFKVFLKYLLIRTYKDKYFLFYASLALRLKNDYC